MTRLQWMFIGASAGAAGAFAVALAVAPSAPTTATAVAAVPVTVTAPAPIVAAPTVAAVPVARKAAAKPAPTTFAPGEAGMMIAIDPETGEAGMPSAEQRAAMGVDEATAVSRDTEGLVSVYHPNGMVSMDLQGRMQDYAVVRMGKDGKPTFGCIQHPDQLDHTHLAPTALEEE